jgi:predicted Zn-dependent protease
MPSRRLLPPLAVWAVAAVVMTGCASPPGQSPGPSPLDPGTRLPTTAVAPDTSRAARLLDQAWEMLAQHPADDDAAAALRVAAVLARLVAAAPVAGREASATRIEIRLLASQVPDAWCPLLERCAVTRGLLEVAGDDDGVLAAALAHELAHALLGHPIERLARTHDLAQERRVALLLGQPHDQVHEHEVTGLSVELLARAGFDPRAPIRLWSALVPASPSTALPPRAAVANGGFGRRHPQAAGWPETLVRHARRFPPPAGADAERVRGIINGYPGP